MARHRLELLVCHPTNVDVGSCSHSSSIPHSSSLRLPPCHLVIVYELPKEIQVIPSPHPNASSMLAWTPNIRRCTEPTFQHLLSNPLFHQGPCQIGQELQHTYQPVSSHTVAPTKALCCYKRPMPNIQPIALYDAAPYLTDAKCAAAPPPETPHLRHMVGGSNFDASVPISYFVRHGSRREGLHHPHAVRHFAAGALRRR